jgi:hypothetical protein
MFGHALDSKNDRACAWHRCQNARARDAQSRLGSYPVPKVLGGDFLSGYLVQIRIDLGRADSMPLPGIVEVPKQWHPGRSRHALTKARVVDIALVPAAAFAAKA